MKFLLFCLLIIPSLAFCQAIDGEFAFQTNNAKKYSLYLPSDYSPDQPQTLMLGLHPLNTNRWNAQSWRDTLINFAEENSLLLVCPDGGLDGKIDDAIDTAFTSVLLDSVSNWYNIDEDEKYIMGFSWGGKTTYTYGLRRTDNFKGYMVIGAAVTLGEVSPLISAAKGEAFYLIHGSNDAVSTRFTPLLAALESNEACVESQLLQGVGHTIDFPERDAIFGEAFQSLKSSSCGTSSVKNLDTEAIPMPSPNPFSEAFYLDSKISNKAKVELYDTAGRAIGFSKEGQRVEPVASESRIIIVKVKDGESEYTYRLIQE